MHGTIFVELKKYVDTKFGGEVWAGLLKEAGLGQRIDDAFETYPDEEPDAWWRRPPGSPEPTPPRLRVERQGPDALVLKYTSERKMCKVGEGIAKGLARHCGERIAIDQATCMQRRDPECSIRVRRLGTA